MVNHPNGLLDPLVVATNNPRIQHFLVRAAVFKKPLVKKLLATLNLMPIYRIRDGVQELSKNQQIFETCYEILRREKALMIFPEGSHNRMRSIRPLSKGFTRILFGTLERHPSLAIHIVPVGLTYQNASVFPTKVALHYGQPILANDYYDANNVNDQIVRLKRDVSRQMQALSVHIPNENYTETLAALNKAQVDFTKVQEVNAMISSGKIAQKSHSRNYALVLKPLLIVNTLIPYIIWKRVAKKIDEIEFVDTFRFGLNTVLVFIFYSLQTVLVSYAWNRNVGLMYLAGSLLLVLAYTKLSKTPTEGFVG